ncbi:group 1 truncated hemoglobin GlbN [Sphaerisporangium melleum]|uniref:Group 1 truncated hemoglobin n=1 Tax=Sphaerisporangium melleum TaxID=321316 RepID=A0A917QXK5_9ACTN|nr:group 1 truncated hemoglobin [Sphaerisporangium melleum]GGK73680.1 group 1 truncated hemoglobin GlbN [Sphaerisporangium melleum]GII70817.1 group 1 truncated hemoglobin GlbN [Sphaerisporangium melleum]
MASIYDQVGGAEAVAAVVDEFYTRVIADPTLASYFENVDMGKLKAHQRSFVAAALGGPQEYRGKTMDQAHAGLAITGEAFDTVVGHLAGALAACGVPEETIGTIAAALAPLKEQIVQTPAAA